MAEESQKSSEQLQQENPQQAVQHSAPETGDTVSVAGAQTCAPEAAPAPQAAGGGGGRGGDRGRGGPRRDRRDREAEEGGIESAVVRIYRCSKVVKGGRTFSF